MGRWVSVVWAAVFLLGGLARADARVEVVVDKSAQQLSVSVDGVPRYQWPISTARWGYRTPNGAYRPQRLERQWYSRKYDWSPMPHSIFFHGGYAIHGSYEISRLGSPASHGCIRLHPQNAATLFALVKANRADTTIVVTGDRPTVTATRRASAKSAQNSSARARTPARRTTSRATTFENIFVPPGRGVMIDGVQHYWAR